MTTFKYTFDAHEDVYAEAGARGVTKSQVFEKSIEQASINPAGLGLALIRRVGMGAAKSSRRTVTVRPSTKALLEQIAVSLRLSVEETARLALESYLFNTKSGR